MRVRKRWVGKMVYLWPWYKFKFDNILCILCACCWTCTLFKQKLTYICYYVNFFLNTISNGTFLEILWASTVIWLFLFQYIPCSFKLQNQRRLCVSERQVFTARLHGLLLTIKNRPFKWYCMAKHLKF